MHARGEIARAGVNYAAAAAVALTIGGKGYEGSPPMANFGSAIDWPWDVFWWKPDTARRMLVKACALLDRAEAQP